jgi:hypothetical protein
MAQLQRIGLLGGQMKSLDEKWLQESTLSSSVAFKENATFTRLIGKEKN